MANLEIIALNTTTPQLLAPQAGDGYKATLVWNNGATTFSGMLFDVTNTASAAASRIMDMQVGGTSVFNVTPSTTNPGLTVTNSSAATLFSVSNTTIIGTRTVQLTPSANTSALTVGSFSLSGANAQSMLDLAGTWNTSGTPTAIKLNVTDTASNANSLLMDLQVGGVSGFSVSKSSTGFNVSTTAGVTRITTSATQLGITAAFGIQFVSASAGLRWTDGVGNVDLLLSRKAAANLQLGAADAAAPVAQTIGPQSVVAGTSNTAGANFTIRGSQGTGTGVGGDIIVQTAAAGTSGTAQNALAERLRVTGAGSVIVNNAAIATNATDGFLYVPTCAGTPTGTPTAFTGRAPIVVDTTNNKLYFYSGGAWRDAGP